MGYPLMFERSSRQVQSKATSGAASSSISFGTDLSRDPVYLDGEVAPSVAFAEAMLVMAKVVKLRKPPPRDSSVYQQWVSGEYQKMLGPALTLATEERLRLQNEVESLNAELAPYYAELAKLRNIGALQRKKQAYFNWLYEHDRATWVVLDPIVSVQRDGTFFEAFSADESVYARVFLPHEALNSDRAPTLGTTNIDFSSELEREFDRVRTYRPLKLVVGLDSVDVTTSAASVSEEKIPLPETWVRGLVEVQSVLSLAPIDFTMSADAIAEVIARLHSEKEKTGPRSLKFLLKPNQAIRVEIEPWGEIFADDWFTYRGDHSVEIRVWGRRRLAVLSDFLTGVDSVQVRLLGSGMPSFWTAVRDGVELTLGLSGWGSNDWATKAKFSAFIPAIDTDDDQVSAALQILMSHSEVTVGELSQDLNVSTGAASALLQKLCLVGKAMYDPARERYRWRDLFPTLDLNKGHEASREERKGLELARTAEITWKLNEVKGTIRYMAAVITDQLGSFSPLLELDEDMRPKYAQCNCSFYNYNRLKQGPCRHMVALSLLGGQE